MRFCCDSGGSTEPQKEKNLGLNIWPNVFVKMVKGNTFGTTVNSESNTAITTLYRFVATVLLIYV
jgi:hypothetical protein